MSNDKMSLRIDVLDLISSISNEEVFTPPKSVNLILDLLPQDYWSDKSILWFDPVAKTGVFLREIYRRLMAGLEAEFENPHERHEHIFAHMLGAASTSRISALATRRTMFGNKSFEASSSAKCNGFHDFVLRPIEDKPLPSTLAEHQLKPWFSIGDWVGQIPKKQKSEIQGFKDMFEFISKKNKKAGLQAGLTRPSKIVFVGNPPYQESDGGHGASAAPIYHKFVENAQQVADEIVFVIPARWYAGGKGLDDFRKAMLECRDIVKLVDFPNSRTVFPSNNIEGGVCFLHWRKGHQDLCQFIDHAGAPHFIDLSAEEILSRDNIGNQGLLAKVLAHASSNGWPCLDSQVSSRKPFGLATNFSDFSPATDSDALPCLTKEGTRHVKQAIVKRGLDMVKRWKVVCSRADGAANKTDDSGRKQVLSTNTLQVLPPSHVCLETYLVVGSFETKAEAESCRSWMATKLARYLLGLRKIDQNVSKEKFSWVPAIPTNKPWSDADAYALFNLTQGEIDAIEKVVK